LLIASVGMDGSLVELTRELRIVRLGQGVDATGELHPDALARVFAAASEYAERLRKYEVQPELTRVVATSAARDARNVEDLFAGMQQRLGVRPVVISGEEEARLSYVGALSGVDPALVDGSGSVLVMDIGGGSTELVLGDTDGCVERSVSLDIGSVRLTERFGLVGPVPPGALSAAIAYVDGLLGGVGWSFEGLSTWIGVAGTVTTVSAVVQELPAYDRSRVHGSTVLPGQLAGLVDRLAALTAEQIRGFGAMEPGRADVITAGTLIADRIARRVRRPMLVSETDILDGLALSLLPAPAAAPPCTETHAQWTSAAPTPPREGSSGR
jgi:exopolyphosphatase/guanosine-5'-triphosphate,3'-diphosphate pyrophosphatase